jgi:hypothetical protein
MDEVNTLIARYRAVGPNRDGTLDGLLANIQDPRVPEFVLTIAENPREDRLARINVLRRFEHFAPRDSVLAQKLRKAFLEIISSDPNPLVRSYAISALSSQSTLREVTDVVVPILTDSQEDRAVREAAFYIYTQSAPWPGPEPLVRQLLSDPDLGETARVELAYRNRKK